MSPLSLEFNKILKRSDDFQHEAHLRKLLVNTFIYSFQQNILELTRLPFSITIIWKYIYNNNIIFTTYNLFAKFTDEKTQILSH